MINMTRFWNFKPLKQTTPKYKTSFPREPALRHQNKNKKYKQNSKDSQLF